MVGKDSARKDDILIYSMAANQHLQFFCLNFTSTFTFQFPDSVAAVRPNEDELNDKKDSWPTGNLGRTIHLDAKNDMTVEMRES